jgi:4-cresol dehydrogenase (hydroxylating)
MSSQRARSPGPRADEVADSARTAVRALTVALGAEKVLTSEHQLREFRDPYAHESWDEHTASAVVMPRSIEEIRQVLRIANETGVPLWTHSQGRNTGYGGPAPCVKGSVIVSLRNMNRVLEINETLGYAVVEPGVRWFDLYAAIEAAGAPLMLSVANIGWGSVIGNTLERGTTYLPYGLDLQTYCGMEIVLANGDVMRTGMGAMDGNRAWHCYRHGMGPTPDQMFMQSNFGIVTKMGVWLMPKPEVYMPLWVRVWHDDDLGALVDTVRELMLDGTIRVMPLIQNTMRMAALVARRDQWHDGDGAVPGEIIERMARELDTGRWMMRFALFDDDVVVEHRFARIKRAFETVIPGCDVWGTKHSPDEIAGLDDPNEVVGGGVPSLALNTQTAWYGGKDGGHVGFSPVGPLTGLDAVVIRDLMRSVVEDAGLDYMGAFLPLTARAFIHVTLILFDTKHEQQARRAYDVARRLVVEAARLGYGEYRAHLDSMDLAAEQYAFNDHAYRRFNETIKDALDPNGILSPGKQGIWPRRFRGGPGAADGIH